MESSSSSLASWNCTIIENFYKPIIVSLRSFDIGECNGTKPQCSHSCTFRLSNGVEKPNVFLTGATIYCFIQALSQDLIQGTDPDHFLTYRSATPIDIKTKLASILGEGIIYKKAEARSEKPNCCTM